MRDDNDEFLFGKLLQKGQDGVPRVLVERARRLVREDDLGLLDERPRDGDALLLPARKFVGLALFHARELHLFERRPDLMKIHRLPLQFEGDCQIVTHGEGGQQVILLKDEAHRLVAEVVEVLGREIARAPAVKDELPFVGIVQSAQDVQERALAAARLAQNEHHAALAEPDGNAL